MAAVNGSFTVVGGSGNYKVRLINCANPTVTLAFTDLINKATNGSVDYEVLVQSPINISYKLRIEDITFGTLFAETSCGDLVCECVPIDVGSITGTSSGFINTTYNYTPSIDTGSSPISHQWSVTGGANLTNATSLTCSVIFTTAGTYTLTYTGTNPCGTDTITKTIAIATSCTDPVPAVSLTASTTEICGTQSATITATGCTGNVVWTNILGSPITNPNSNNNVFIVTEESKTVKAKCFNCQGSSSYSNIVSITYLGACVNINNVIGNSVC